MAANAKTQIRGIMECSICMEIFKKPKFLPCVHSFCLDCLEGCGKDEKPGDEMSCPLCRALFKIPPGGLKQLPNNFLIEQMKELLVGQTHQESTNEDKMACEVCKKVDASKFCVECSQNLCESCEAIHRTIRATLAHKIVTQEEKISSQLIKSTRSIYCEKHTNQEIDLYCKDCETAICVKCSILHHRNHETIEIQQAADSFMSNIRENINGFDIFILTTKNELKQIETDKEKNILQLSESESAIKKKGEEVKRLVDSQVSQLLQQLEAIKADNLKIMKTRTDEVERRLLILQSFQQYVQVLNENGVPYDVTRSAKDLSKRAEEIVTSQAEFENGTNGFQNVTFQESDFESTTKTPQTQLVGTLLTEDNYCKTMLLIGFPESTVVRQQIGQVNLSRMDTVNTINTTPSYIGWEAAAYTFENSLYIVGLGISRNELWKYSAQFNWIRLADMESGRRRHCVAVVGSMLYVLGGWDERTTLSSVLSYNISSNTWSTVGQLTHAVRSAACVAYKGSIHAFGGITLDNNDTTHVQIYNTSSEQCTLTSKALPRACRMLRAVLWRTSAVLLNCYTCFIYGFETQTWLERSQYKTDVYHFGLVLHNYTLYIAGGGIDKKDKDNKLTWTCSDEIKSVSVMDIISNKPAVWKHHAKLPLPGSISAYSPSPLRLHWK